MERGGERGRDLRDRGLGVLDTSVGGPMSGPGSSGGLRSAYRQRSPTHRDRDLIRDRNHRPSISGPLMGIEHRSSFPQHPHPNHSAILDRDRIDLERERESHSAMLRSRSRGRVTRDRDRDRDKDRDRERELIRDRERELIRERDRDRYAVGVKSAGVPVHGDFYDLSHSDREQRAKAAAE